MENCFPQLQRHFHEGGRCRTASAFFFFCFLVSFDMKALLLFLAIVALVVASQPVGANPTPPKVAKPFLLLLYCFYLNFHYITVI